MAISKERLEELIEQDKVFYWVFNKEVMMLCNLSILPYWKENWELYGKNCFENKEDAEFVAKYHTQRPVYFSPPTYEEFLKLNNRDTCWDFITKNNQRNYILVGNDYYAHNDMMKPKKEWTIVVQDEYDDYIFEEPLTKENYIKAVEYARKLFLGDKNA